MIDRTASRDTFLRTARWADAELQPFAQDASFRRYFRLLRAHQSVLLMDAPPQLEPIAPFVLVAEHLGGLGFSTPQILARDDANGWLLLEDFGNDTFTHLLATNTDEAQLYEHACDTLIALHKHRCAADVKVPVYTLSTLLQEAALLTQWYIPALVGSPCSDEQHATYLAAWEQVFETLGPAPPTLVLRDYHVDNLMLLPKRDGVRRCGLLDFQDARIGPAAYDLASLLEDARRTLPDSLRRTLYSRYVAAFSDLDEASFLRWFNVLAAQRHAKVAGIFVRLCIRDGKSKYLRHIPRVVAYLQAHLARPELAPVAQWLCHHCPDLTQPLPPLKQAEGSSL